MSHGPFGLGEATLGPACAVIVNVAPISASASISRRLIFVFTFLLCPLPNSIPASRVWLRLNSKLCPEKAFTEGQTVFRCNASKSKCKDHVKAKNAGVASYSFPEPDVFAHGNCPNPVKLYLRSGHVRGPRVPPPPHAHTGRSSASHSQIG